MPKGGSEIELLAELPMMNPVQLTGDVQNDMRSYNRGNYDCIPDVQLWMPWSVHLTIPQVAKIISN